MSHSGRAGEVEHRVPVSRPPRTSLALIAGIALVSLAVVPEFLAGGAAGFGPLQSGCLIGGVTLIAASAWLGFRSTRAVQAPPRDGAATRARVRWLARLILLLASLAVAFAMVEVWTRWRLGTSPEERRWRALVAAADR